MTHDDRFAPWHDPGDARNDEYERPSRRELEAEHLTDEDYTAADHRRKHGGI